MDFTQKWSHGNTFQNQNMNITVYWLALQICIQEVSGLNIGRILAASVVVYLSYLKMDHDNCAPHPLKFNIDIRCYKSCNRAANLMLLSLREKSELSSKHSEIPQLYATRKSSAGLYPGQLVFVLNLQMTYH
jgi:hypothetical protein